ncbi:MAG: hypothetical protein IT245_04165 [Bacteroidia bacterium]|nr:hypothetical protein [Bacteroidia bacterium]
MISKVRYKHLALVLIPLLFFNIGLQIFHDCNNLNHHHDSPSFELSHDRCLVCEAKQHPYTGTDLLIVQFSQPEYSIPKPIESLSIICIEIDSAANKGPPVII